MKASTTNTVGVLMAAITLLSLSNFSTVHGFHVSPPSFSVKSMTVSKSPSSIAFGTTSTKTDRRNISSSSALFFFNKAQVEDVAVVTDDDGIDDGWTDFGKNPLSYAYAGAWVLLVSFAVFFAPGEINSAADTAMIQSIIDNPSAPDMNPFFLGIFNEFALIPIVLACTIAPRTSDKGGIPAGPPLFLSTFIAFFVMGPYLALRKEPKTVIENPAEEFGWLTRNVWENKVFNYANVAFGVLLLASAAPGLENPTESWNGMVGLIQTSRLASVSLADLSLITLILTKEIADDYKIRCDPEDADKATLIGASTALLPILGATIYCAARPTLLSTKSEK